jgi:uncharacterized repeat protein (TIGR03847 family)
VNTQRLDLGRADDVHVESFGEPGQRTFRIHVEKGTGRVSLWIEKFQVVLLETALAELLERTSAGGAGDEDVGPMSFMGDLEVQVGALAIAYLQEDHLFLIEATELSSAFELEAVVFRTDREHIQSMHAECERLVAASRPRCVLCGAPLTGEPHFCPQQNGHARVRADDQE